MRKATRKDWIKCSVAVVLYLLFLLWVKSWWGLLVLPFIVDNYITKFIPWCWWKNSRSKLVRGVMSWVDSIVFALVAVYFVHQFLFQNYVIPTSSLEKSLLVGDYLFVSKANYGPRKPQTPLSMPLTQHTMPLTGGKSYIDAVQWDYERVPGFEKIELGDIVVFNYPAGDTATTNPEVIDYYKMCYTIGAERFPNRPNLDSLSIERRRAIFDLYYNTGREEIEKNPHIFGEKVWRPVDRRENYVKRCVGLPGDVLQIKNKVIYLNNKASKQPKNAQFNYWVTFKAQMPERLRHELGISKKDLIDGNCGNGLYCLPLTDEVRDKLATYTKLVASIEPYEYKYTGDTYPLNGHTGWTADNYGPVWIPKKGESIDLTLDNIAVYERPIAVYEGNKLQVKDGLIFINDKPADSYTFKMDYYWMMGDNRHNSADSRYWGFVPEDHIVGKPLFIWLSLDEDRGWFDGKIRWNRLFRSVGNYN
ncbi:MAG: S26 family signal peptidase [Bacteroidaceae bacterium]|nr:S26 family signal peptidase [Bacteroidaceae bacterium]